MTVDSLSKDIRNQTEIYLDLPNKTPFLKSTPIYIYSRNSSLKQTQLQLDHYVDKTSVINNT
jgi:hypothetical protein